ncbi:hypothetical protein ACEWY4_016924 [Coilia grayii]|uniref:Reelin domain-containing protein n=1 Tax=Coilia grayii TaxID=363190 RepID=A0ABD1JMZ4_9TELE
MLPHKRTGCGYLWSVWLLVCVFERCVDAYPTGAPSSVCVSMLPNHGVGPQSTGSPFNLTVNASTYRHGELITVYIGSSETYRGILLQARSADSSAAVGSWINLPSHFQTLKCGTEASALTHSSARDRGGGKDVFTWRPPNTGAPQVLRFWATVVKDEDTFWTEIKSSALHLDASESSPNGSDPTGGSSGSGGAAGSKDHLAGCVSVIVTAMCVWLAACV